MMKLKRYWSFLVLAMMPLLASAQSPAMADKFREDGKIYVVVTVAAIILVGILVYLFMLDRKVSKIEKQLNK